LGYRVWSVSTKTWADRVELLPSSCSWSRTMNAGSGGSATFNLSDPTVRAYANLTELYPGQRAIVVDYDDVVVYAGIIWDTSYDRDTKKLTVSHSDIWSLFDLRLISAVREQEVVNWQQTYSGLEYDTIIKRLVQLATTGTGRSIPMNYETDYPGGRSRTYYGYNLDTLMDSMQEIMDLSDGPDVDFRPEWDGAGGLQFTVRTGELTLNEIELNFSADQPAATGLWIKTNAQNLATQVFAVGEGSGKKTAKSAGLLVRESQSSNIADYPSMERIEQFKNTKKGDELYSQAASALIANNQAIRQAGCQVSLNSPVLGSMWDLRPGTYVHWYIREDPYFTTGWRDWRVLKYSGDIASNFVTLEFQPKGG
jgi:hypothetical protein